MTKRPGASTSAGPAQSAAQGRVSSPTSRSTTKAGRFSSSYLKQNHGGWNSDDNQNNNLGRFRLSITNAPEPSRRSACRRTCRESSNIPRRGAHAATGRRHLQLLAHHGAGMASEANERIEALWAHHPAGSIAAGAAATREQPRATHLLDARRFSEAGTTGVSRACRHFCIALPAEHRQRA